MSPPYLKPEERKALTEEERWLWTELLSSGEAEGTKGLLLHRLAEARGLLKEMCRGHNARGSDGPCDCSASRYLKERGLT